MSAKGWFGGALALFIVVGACNSGNDSPVPAAAPSPAGVVSAGTASLPATPVTVPAAPAGASGVARVIDGDTFELDNGDRVRVLGIDSCEMSTDAGDDAKRAAETFLSGSQITLATEPGVDRDKYGRLLRYVSSASGDMGEYMIISSHTGIYQGRNDASAAKLSDLRSRDVSGRTCEDPYVPPAPDPDPVYVPDTSDNEDRYVPAPSKRRTGNSGHPCLPGERDGDDDGYCGEGR